MTTKEKIFSKYTMVYLEDEIKNVLDNKGATTKFSYTFYTNNKLVLDNFKNINEWVKPKKEMIPRNNVVVNLDDYSVKYSNNNEKVNEDDLRQVMRIIKNELSEQNPEIAKQKALLIKYTNDVKTLKELASEDFDFNEEIEELEEKIENTKKVIDSLIED